MLAYCSGLQLPTQHISTAHSLHSGTQNRNHNALLLVRIRASSVDIIWLSSLRFSWILTWLKLLVELFLLTQFAPLYANFQTNSGVFLRLGNLRYLVLSIGCAFPTHLFLELCVCVCVCVCVVEFPVLPNSIKSSPKPVSVGWLLRTLAVSQTPIYLPFIPPCLAFGEHPPVLPPLHFFSQLSFPLLPCLVSLHWHLLLPPINLR